MDIARRQRVLQNVAQLEARERDERIRISQPPPTGPQVGMSEFEALEGEPTSTSAAPMQGSTYRPTDSPRDAERNASDFPKSIPTPVQDETVPWQPHVVRRGS